MDNQGNPTILVEVSPNGDVKIDAQCFVGSGCVEATEQLEMVLGGGAQKSKTMKPEYFSSTDTAQVEKMTF